MKFRGMRTDASFKIVLSAKGGILKHGTLTNYTPPSRIRSCNGKGERSAIRCG